jgi:hypothetical protein
MNLETQIQSLIFSLVFGMFFALMFNIFYKQLFLGRTVFKIISNVFFVTCNVLLYFGILKTINDGIIHPYFLLMLFIGFTIGNKKAKMIRKIKLDI